MGPKLSVDLKVCNYWLPGCYLSLSSRGLKMHAPISVCLSVQRAVSTYAHKTRPHDLTGTLHKADLKCRSNGKIDKR